MEAFLVLLGLSIVGGFVWAVASSIYLVATVGPMKRRIAALEARLRAIDPDASAEAPARGPAAVQSNLRGTAPRTESPPTPEMSEPKRDAEPERSTEAPPAEEPANAPTPTAAIPEHFVFTQENKAAFGTWFAANWFYVVAAVSLAVAGIFFVRYGIENGLLPPTARVLSGLGLGVILILVAERVRRIGGSGPDTMGHLLPATLAAGGVVSLYAAILGARVLYDLIGVEMAFAGMVAVAVAAVLLGLLHGSFLSIIGIAGAVIAPFIVGGQSADTAWLFYYFAVIGWVALGTDAYRRTAWLSTAGLILVYGGAGLLYLGTAHNAANFLAFAGLTAVGALTVPTLTLRPAFTGAMMFNTLHRQGELNWPEFPTRLAAGGILGLVAAATFVSMDTEISFWLSLVALGATLLVLAFWMGSDTLDDLAPITMVAMGAVVGLNGFFDFSAAAAHRYVELDFEETPPQTILMLVLYGAVVTALTARKSMHSASFQIPWAFASASFAPALIWMIALWWSPMTHMSNATWALHVAGVAIVMTVLTQLSLKDDDSWRLRPSLYALAALNLIAFAVSIVLTETALTLAFASVLLSASWLDRRFDLKLLSWFVQAAVVVCGYRLLLDPGIAWALEAPLIEVVIAFAGVAGLMTIALPALKHRGREAAFMVVESSVWSIPGVLVCILLYRALDDSGQTTTHWALSLFGMIWLISGGVQLYRARASAGLRTLRLGLGALFTTIGTLLLLSALTVANPLFTDLVLGPPVFDSLFVAFALPAMLIAGLVRVVRLDSIEVNRIADGLAALSIAVYAGLEIRRLWHGTDLTVPGVLDGELYAYTAALLLVGAGLLLWSFVQGSALIRRAAMGVIGLAIAKVFLIDISGLEGLIRVVSFLVLGLVLAGLAWLDGVMARRIAQQTDQPPSPT